MHQCLTSEVFASGEIVTKRVSNTLLTFQWDSFHRNKSPNYSPKLLDHMKRNTPGSRVIFGFADWKATLHVSYFTYYKVILVFIILQIFSTRWKNFNEQHIVCCMGCLLFGILW